MKRVALLLALVALFLYLYGRGGASPLPTLAQSGGGYDLTWNTVDGGGATFSSGGSYTLGGTIGQPDAGALSGGSYTLAGGFWVGAVSQPSPSKVYLPIILQSGPSKVYLPIILKNKS
jgi:hypothetical protein